MSNEDVCSITKFVERDIDILMAEELRVSEEFCRWVMEKFGLADQLRYPAISTNVSVLKTEAKLT